MHLSIAKTRIVMSVKKYIAKMLEINEKLELINKSVDFFKAKTEKEITSCEETEKNPSSFDFEKKMKGHRFRMSLLLNKLDIEYKNLNELEKSAVELQKEYRHLL